MSKIIVTGCGTDVGKTVVSAIIATALDGEYWKPVQCSPGKDTLVVKKLSGLKTDRIHLPAYDFYAPCSPHFAAKIENTQIDPSTIRPPSCLRPLIIETAGGVLVPLCNEMTMLDLLQGLGARCVVVSRHYIGSINHTLLTLEALKRRHIDVPLLIFNGEEEASPGSVEAICHFSKINSFLTLKQERKITKKIITEYALKWKKTLVEKLCSP